MTPEFDEYGIPVKSSRPMHGADEYGIPIKQSSDKKKDLLSGAIQGLQSGLQSIGGLSMAGGGVTKSNGINQLPSEKKEPDFITATPEEQKKTYDAANKILEQSIVPDDPVKSLRNYVKNTDAIGQRNFVNRGDISQTYQPDIEAQKAGLADKFSIEHSLDNIFPTFNDAKNHLLDRGINQTTQTHVLNNGQSLTLPVKTDNETDQIAINRYNKGLEIRNIADHNPIPEMAAVQMAVSRGDKDAKILSQEKGFENIPPLKMGQLMYNYINDPDIKEYAKENPQLQQELRQATFQLPEKYPEAAVQMMAQYITDQRQKLGYNNGILKSIFPVKPQHTSDEIISDAVQKGIFPQSYKNLYDKAAPIVNTLVKTPDLISNFGEGLESGMRGLAKTIESPVTAFTKSDEDILKEKYSTPQTQIQPQGLLQNFTVHGSNFLGYMFPLMAGGEAMKIADILKSSAAGRDMVMFGMTSLGDNIQRAREEMPNEDPLKQYALAALTTGVQVSAAKYLGFGKALEITPELTPLKDLINDFSSGKITSEAAIDKGKQIIGNLANRFISSGKKGLETGTVIGGMQTADNILQQVFSNKPFDLSQAGQAAMSGFTSGFFGGAFLGGVKPEYRPTVSKSMYQMLSVDPDKYRNAIEQSDIPQEQKQDQLSNFDYALKTFQQLPKDWTDKQKRQFILESVSQYAKEKTVPENKVLATEPQKTIDEHENNQQQILKGKDVYNEPKEETQLTPQETQQTQQQAISSEQPIEVKSNKDVSKVFDRLLKDEHETDDYGIHGLLADWGAEYDKDNDRLIFEDTRSGTGKMRLSKKDFINDILSGKLEKEVPASKEFIDKVKQSILDELGIKQQKQAISSGEQDEVVKQRISKISSDFGVDENTATQIHEAASNSKDFDEFKSKIKELVPQRGDIQFSEEGYEGWASKEEFEKSWEKFNNKLQARLNSGEKPPTGINEIKQELQRGVENGRISPKASELANALLDSNPNLFKKLSFKISKGTEGELGGMYNPFLQMVRIFEGTDDPDTVVHELLHHTERFLPDEYRKKIAFEWSDATTKALKRIEEKAKTLSGEEKQRFNDAVDYLKLSIKRFNHPDKSIQNEDYANIVNEQSDLFHKIGSQSLYQYLTPSEWWAENGSRIFRERKEKQDKEALNTILKEVTGEKTGWVDKVKEFYTKLIEAAKKVFGKTPQYYRVEKALNKLLKGEKLSESKAYSELSGSIKLDNDFESKLKSLWDEIQQSKKQTPNIPLKTEIKEPTNPEVNKVGEAATEKPPTPPSEKVPVGEGDNEGRKVGISHESLNKLAQKLGLPDIPRGTRLTPKQYRDRGRRLLDANPDLYKQVEEDFKNDKQPTADDISIAAAHLEDLENERNRIGDDKKLGMNSEEYKNAEKELDKWAREVAKPMGTKASEPFTALQGERDLDTGSFTAVTKAKEDALGRKLKESEIQTSKNLAAKVENLEKENESLKSKLDDALSKAAGKKIKPKIDLDEWNKKAHEAVDKFFNFGAEGLRANPLAAFKPFIHAAIDGITEAMKAGKSLAEAIKEQIEKFKETDFYKNLSEKDKNDRIERMEVGLPEIFKDSSEEGKKIKRLEKQLEDLQKGKIKQKNIKTEDSQEIKDLKEKIFEAKKNLGLIPSKEKKLTEQEAEEEKQKKYNDLVTQLAGKQDNIFTPEQSQGIWDYMKETYINDNPNYQLSDAIHKTSMDLGLRVEQISHALARDPKSKQISDQMYINRRNSNRARNEVTRWVKKDTESPVDKVFNTIGAPFRGMATFAHATALLFTHAIQNVYDYRTAAKFFQLAAKQYKIVYGNEKYFQQFVSRIKNDPLYPTAIRAGAAIDPDVVYDDWQLANNFLRKMGIQGQKGFAILKAMRFEIWKSFYKDLSAIEKQDQESLSTIAGIANHWGGTAGIKPSAITNFVFFAPNLVVSKFARLVTDPTKALYTYSRMATNAAAKKLGKEEPFDISTSEKVAARIITKKSARVFVGYMAALAANQGLLMLTGSNQRINFLNPNKSDWLKFKIGDKTIDASGGMVASGQFLAQLGALPFLSKGGIKENYYGAQSPSDAYKKTITGYFRRTLSPVTSIGVDLLTHTDFRGNVLPFYSDKPSAGKEKLSIGGYAMQKMMIPVSEGYQDMMDEMKSDGTNTPTTKNILHSLIAAGLGAHGIKLGKEPKQTGLQLTEDEKKDPRVSWVKKEWNMELPNVISSSETITKEDQRFKDKLNTLPPDEQKKYTDAHVKNLFNVLGDIHDNGSVYVKEYKDSQGNPDNSVRIISTEGKKFKDIRSEIKSAIKEGYEEKSLKDLSDDEKAKVLRLAQDEASKQTKKDLFKNE